METVEVEVPSWTWIWSEVCPVEKRGTNTLDECQQICLQIILLVFISIASAYHFGRQLYPVVRTRTQIWTISGRIFTVGALGVLPIARMYFYYSNGVTIWPIDILLACFECITWIVHLGFLLSLRKRGSVNSRGPLIITVLWAFAFVLSITWFQEGLRKSNWSWRLIPLILQLFYGFTLIPSAQGRLVTRLNRDEEERQALLSNRYVRFQQGVEEASLGPAQDGVTCLSKILFYWVNDLIEKGVEGALKKVEDLFDLPECLSIVKITEKFQKSIDQTKTLFWALHKAFGREFYTIGLLRFLGDISGFAGPLLLGGLIGKEDSSETSPFLYAFGLFASAIVAALSIVHFNWRISLVTMRMRVALVTAIYRKALEARGLKDSRPDILNLMSTDTDRIVNSCSSFHAFWSIPFQLFTTLYLLYTQIGAAFVAGVIFAVALIPINRWLALRIAKLSQGLMTAKDARVSLCSEALAGAKQIKLYAWEDIFVRRIEELRATELKFLAKRKYLDAVCVYFWATTPILMCLLTFGMSVLTGNILTPATTYTSVALLNMLIGPLNTFPWVLNGLTEAWVSLKRVQELMSLPNIDLTQFYSPVENGKSEWKERPVVLSIEDATFDFEFNRRRDGNEIIVDDVVDFQLDNVSMEVRKGELVCLQGPVGGGKSSLLSAIVADLSRASGTVCIQDLHSGFGYVAQSSWLQRGTIRENIVWGAVFDEQRYKSVVAACALNEDLMQLGGDHVGVGEGGRTLSGGQRARVALARAVYQNKAIYLMDDVLSSLDAHVAAHIVKHCILGLLASKTRIIVTENRVLLQVASQILHVDGGEVTQSELMNYSDDETEEMDEVTENVFSTVQLEGNVEEDKKSVDSIMLEESREYGTIKSGVIFSYWKAMSNTVAFAVFISITLMQVSRNVSDVWLAHWVSQYSLNTIIATEPSLGYFLGIYAGLATSNSAFTLMRAFLFAYAGIKAARHVHRRLLKRVFAAKFQFFDVSPLGRILNRFSSDTYTIDDSLPFIFNILLAQMFGLAGAIIITLIALPWLILLVVPMCPVYVNLQSRYRHASRDIKRLSSNALSPLYAHFTETLQGMATIRAMRASGRFRRDFLVKVEESTRAQLSASAAQQWLGLRLQFLGATLVGGAGILAALTSAHETDPSFVGLAISYALSITSLLGGLLNALAETEQELIAVERVSQYCELEGEVNAAGSMDPPFGWPLQGVVSFDNVVLKYRDHLPPALNRVTFETSAFERVGVVGRTGAGKSSIVASVMRVAPLTIGKIVIDCVDVSTLPISVLRSRIALVPQEPFLFGGTVRDNLDPRRVHFDSEIWSAISACLAAPLVHGLGGLGGFIAPGGTNVSAGERQLLSLARAMLKNSKVVCIDEGTANLNAASEIAIRSVLRTAFRSSTVIFIAHRLSGLQNTDRIFVMNGGEIVESGPPGTLQGDVNSLFHGMVQEQTLSDPTYGH